MTIPGQMSLGAAMPEVPLIYVATPLSHLSPTERTDIISWCEVIDRRAVDAALTDVSPWLVRVHIPSQWSAPWNEDNMTPQEVYALNSTTVYEAAALVVVGYRGGSLGAGQEFAWATGARIPILYLRCQGEPVSRQLQGTPADIIVAEFDNENQLADHIVSFVRSRRSTIENHPQRLRTQAATLAHIVAAMQDLWSNLDPTSQGRAIAESRLVEPRIKELIDNPHALAAAALNEVSAPGRCPRGRPPARAKRSTFTRT